MKLTVLTLLVAIGMFTSAALSQPGFSESTPYKPGQYSKADKKKKKKDELSPKAPIASGTETVSIPISVFDKSAKFIDGLTKEDVKVFVDASEVPVTTFEKVSAPANVVLVLDTSPSAKLRFDTMQEQAWKLVQAFPSNTKVMVVEFNSKMNVLSPLTDDRTKTKAAITKAKMGGGTSLYSAVRTLYQKILPDISGPKVIVLMTDGVDTTSTSSTYGNSLSEAESADVSIYPVYYDTFGDAAKTMKYIGPNFPIPPGILPPTPGASADEYKKGIEYLNDMAAASGGRVFSSEKLERGIRSLVEELSSKYYATISVPKTGTGRRQLRVRVNRPGLAVFARGSFIDQ